MDGHVERDIVKAAAAGAVADVQRYLKELGRPPRFSSRGFLQPLTQGLAGNNMEVVRVLFEAALHDPLQLAQTAARGIWDFHVAREQPRARTPPHAAAVLAAAELLVACCGPHPVTHPALWELLHDMIHRIDLPDIGEVAARCLGRLASSGLRVPAEDSACLLSCAVAHGSMRLLEALLAAGADAAAPPLPDLHHRWRFSDKQKCIDHPALARALQQGRLDAAAALRAAGALATPAVAGAAGVQLAPTQPIIDAVVWTAEHEERAEADAMPVQSVLEWMQESGIRLSVQPATRLLVRATQRRQYQLVQWLLDNTPASVSLKVQRSKRQACWPASAPTSALAAAEAAQDAKALRLLGCGAQADAVHAEQLAASLEAAIAKGTMSCVETLLRAGAAVTPHAAAMIRCAQRVAAARPGTTDPA